MGYRTVVMLSNDMASEWSKDPELGRKIATSMHSHVAGGFDYLRNYGSVVECVHADDTTIAVLGDYDRFHVLAGLRTSYKGNSDEESIALLKEAADRLGYRLVKKSTK